MTPSEEGQLFIAGFPMRCRLCKRPITKFDQHITDPWWELPPEMEGTTYVPPLTHSHCARKIAKALLEAAETVAGYLYSNDCGGSGDLCHAGWEELTEAIAAAKERG